MKPMKLLNYLYRKPKLSISLIFFLLVFFSFALSKTAFAQNPWFNPTLPQHNEALAQCAAGNVGLECTVQAIVKGIFNSLNLVGGSNEITSPIVTSDNTQEPNAMANSSRLVFFLIGHPPTSSGEYVQYLAQKINPVETAYAQSTGYRALSSLILLWSAFRNIAYFAYVVIFIFIGFMIMFRAQINPQTVINIQNSLPNLVITLILITFSYAIAGFLVDLIYLGIYLAVYTLSSQDLITNPTTAISQILNENIFTLASQAGFYKLAADVGTAVEEILNTAFDEGFFDWIFNIIPFEGSLAALIIKVAIVFSMFKLFFQLLMAYINIIVSTLISPILILFNAIPGSNSFTTWIRNMLSNVLIFPAVAMLFLVSAILIGQPETDSTYQWTTDEGLFDCDVRGEPCESWTPPFIAKDPTSRSVMAIIGLGFMLFAPSMVSVLQNALKTKPLPTGGIFAPIAAGARVVSAPVRGISGGVSTGVRTYVGQKIEALAGETRK